MKLELPKDVPCARRGGGRRGSPNPAAAAAPPTTHFFASSSPYASGASAQAYTMGPSTGPRPASSTACGSKSRQRPACHVCCMGRKTGDHKQNHDSSDSCTNTFMLLYAQRVKGARCACVCSRCRSSRRSTTHQCQACTAAGTRRALAARCSQAECLAQPAAAPAAVTAPCCWAALALCSLHRPCRLPTLATAATIVGAACC